MIIKNFKAFLLASVLSIPTFCYGDTPYKVNKTESVSKTNAACINFDNITEETTSIITTSITTTTTTATTSEIVTTTEIVDQFKHLRIFENLKNNNLSIEELDMFIKRYADFSKVSYEEAVTILSDNIQSIESDYDSICGGIMCTLFNYANDNGILSPYTESREIRENMTQQEKEDLIIEFCRNLNLCNDDICIVLAAFREETGNGTSYKCVYDNNFGGIRIYNEAGCNGEYGMYSTPEFGAYRQVKCISNKLKNIRNEGINDLDSVVYNFSCRYNPEYASTYSSKILGWVYDVQSDYSDFSSYDICKKYIK